MMWKILKNPTVGRPIIAGYDGFLPHALILVLHVLNKFDSKFDSIHTDVQLKLGKIVRKSKG